MCVATHPVPVYVPCFSGAPWDLTLFPDLTGWPAQTPALPEGLTSVGAYADWLTGIVDDLPSYVLIGDSFGAAIALELAVRRSTGLQAVVASGGFAANPVRQRLLRGIIRKAAHVPDTVYGPLVVPLHAWLLRSCFDGQGDRKWSMRATRELFLTHTPPRSYWARAQAAVQFDLRSRLDRIAVPVLLLTPQDDKLIAASAKTALRHIPGVQEVVLSGTGHMVRYSHPRTYGREVARFLRGLEVKECAE